MAWSARIATSATPRSRRRGSCSSATRAPRSSSPICATARKFRLRDECRCVADGNEDERRANDQRESHPGIVAIRRANQHAQSFWAVPRLSIRFATDALQLADILVRAHKSREVRTIGFQVASQEHRRMLPPRERMPSWGGLPMARLVRRENVDLQSEKIREVAEALIAAAVFASMIRRACSACLVVQRGPSYTADIKTRGSQLP
jgi:hypothetical protein